MAKTCPSCGYQPIGPFTDNCPICAEPVRNVRSGSAGGGWSAGVWMRWLLGGVIVGVLCVAGCCGSGMWQVGNAIVDPNAALEKAKAHMEEDRKNRTVVVSTADLLQEFHKDADAADRKYQGKCLEISGIVERSGKDGHGTRFAVLHAGDKTAPVKVECFFDYWGDDAIQDDPPARDRTITVRGEYLGRVSHLQLRQCALVR